MQKVVGNDYRYARCEPTAQGGTKCILQPASLIGRNTVRCGMRSDVEVILYGCTPSPGQYCTHGRTWTWTFAKVEYGQASPWTYEVEDIFNRRNWAEQLCDCQCASETTVRVGSVTLHLQAAYHWHMEYIVPQQVCLDGD